ncbi:hypothetical protein DDE74_16090 [Streptomyces lydicus]|uniref:Putative T7SS secretion signal domain-containing protein n=1 Tax=Streptomyces lydicus TaxID=47763 RepID=A0A3S9YBC0_9ACTN|nr:hypothetical protein [Streptomyces lydicus]AZS72276.1 hypothetical protein DDE74_16090 [Streptomyces lydicus]
MSWRYMFIGKDEDWPGIGFNPAKGDLDQIQALASDVKSVGDELDELDHMLKSIGKNDGAWEGEAAEKFTKKLGELPKFLRQGSESMHDCAKALRGWHTHLQGLQKKAVPLESETAAARKQMKSDLDHHQKVYDEYQSHVGEQMDPADAKALADRLDSAQHKADKSRDKLEELVREAERIHSDWSDLADEAERAILKASENHPPDLHWWNRVADGLKAGWRAFKDWLAEHADLLSNISAVLSIASLATMAIPPVGAILGGLAIGASALALAGYGIKASRGGKVGVMDWVGAGLGVLPGIGAVKGLKAAGALAKGERIAAQGGKIANTFKNAQSLKTSENMARGMADGVMHKGIQKVFPKAEGMGVDVAHWGARGTQMGVKGIGLGHRLEANWPDDKPIGKAFLQAAGA